MNATAQEPPTVLFVEDDPDDALLIETAIARSGRDVALEIVGDGHAALLRLLPPAIPPAITFLDINLPLVNGLEVLRTVRSTAARPAPVIVVMTTSTAPADRERALALGCEEFHVKPISFEQFMDIIVGTLDRWVAGDRASRG